MNGNRKGSKFERRFWEKTRKQGECLIWNGTILGTGYGQFWNGEKRMLAHRYSMELKLGRKLLPEELVLHRCDDKGCVSHSHLFLGDYQDNSDDMVQKGRSLFGKRANGVLLDEERVRKIRTSYAEGSTLKEIGRKFQVHFTNVWQIVNRRTWRHI